MTVYGHLTSLTVSTGQTVSRGQVIAMSVQQVTQQDLISTTNAVLTV